MQVVKITETQKDLLIGKTWDECQFFNPQIDLNGNYYISKNIVDNCSIAEFQWLKGCELIDYNPINEI